MEILHSRCARLDVHKDTVVAAVRLTEGDGSVRVGAAAGRDLRDHHAGAPGAIGLAGAARLPLHRHGGDRHLLAPGQVLAAEGRTLVLANAAHVKNVPGRKTDVADAVWLSDLAPTD